MHVRDKYEEWLQLDHETRKRAFAPVKVRIALESAGCPIPIDEKQYGELSAMTVHVSPTTQPNVHASGQRPTSGGYFKDVSALLALNEIAGATAIAAFGASQISSLAKEHKKQIAMAAKDLLESVGGISLVTLRERAAVDTPPSTTH